MVARSLCATGLMTILAAAGEFSHARAAGPIALREALAQGAATRVDVHLTAQGQYVPSPDPGANQAKTPKSLPLKAEVRLEFVEKIAKVDAQGRAQRAIRRVLRAASAVQVGNRPTTTSLRPEVAIQVAEPRPEGVGVLVFSPLAAMTRPELDLVQGPGDPIALAGLLPDRPVAVKDHWVVADAAARSLSSYDKLASNKLEATLESMDDETATLVLRGELRGSVLDAEGTMACDGTCTFDRKLARISRLTLRRAETRGHGQVEGGLDVKSTLEVSRRAVEKLPAELADDVLARLSLEPDAKNQLLVLDAADGRYSLRVDRNWYLFSEDVRQVVLKRLEGGRLVAQCNLVTASKGTKGRPDPTQFRDEVRNSLGPRFVQFLGTGEVDGDPAGGFRYKVGVQGRQGDVGIIWYTYLIEAPDGDRLVATFTLAEAEHKAFGDKDEALIGSLRWKRGSADPVGSGTAATR